MNAQLILEIREMRGEVKALRHACEAIAVVNRSTEQLLKVALTSDDCASGSAPPELVAAALEVGRDAVKRNFSDIFASLGSR